MKERVRESEGIKEGGSEEGRVRLRVGRSEGAEE